MRPVGSRVPTKQTDCQPAAFAPAAVVAREHNDDLSPESRRRRFYLSHEPTFASSLVGQGCSAAALPKPRTSPHKMRSPLQACMENVSPLPTRVITVFFWGARTSAQYRCKCTCSRLGYAHCDVDCTAIGRRSARRIFSAAHRAASEAPIARADIPGSPWNP